MRSRLVLLAFVMIASAVMGWIAATDCNVDVLGQEKPSSSAAATAQLPKPDPAFKGQIGETFKDSKPDYPQPVKAPKGARSTKLHSRCHLRSDAPPAHDPDLTSDRFHLTAF